MKIIFLFNGTDPDCLKLAQRLVEQTEAEVRHSNGMQPTLWLDGVMYYGFEDVLAKVEEVLGVAGRCPLCKGHRTLPGDPLIPGVPESAYAVPCRMCGCTGRVQPPDKRELLAQWWGEQDEKAKTQWEKHYSRVEGWWCIV